MAAPYLEGRGIDLGIAEEFRCGVIVAPHSGHESYVGRLAIPSIGPNGVYQMKFRCMGDHECKDLGHSKYLTDAMDNRLFNVRAIVSASNVICVTEGELDSVVLTMCGFPSVAAPGSNTWKRHHPRMFAGFTKVYVFGDGDKAGQAFSKTVADSMGNSVRLVMPEGEDVNSLYVSAGVEGIYEIMGVDGGDSYI